MRQLHPIKRLTALALCAALAFASCKKNPSEPENAEQPALPPLASMKMDLQPFSSDQALPKVTDPQTPGANFTNAAIRVALINAIVGVHMAIPVATFAAAISQKPELRSDGWFHWVFNVTHAGLVYQADLAGRVDLSNSQSLWEMRITVPTANPPLDKFLWYKGTAKLDNSAGQWIIYDHKQPGEEVEVVHIDWLHSSETQAKLVFTVVKPGVDENGDTLTYQANNSERSVVLFDNSENVTHQVFWDATTHAGYLITPTYNNGQKACWDEQLNDVACQ